MGQDTHQVGQGHQGHKKHHHGNHRRYDHMVGLTLWSRHLVCLEHGMGQLFVHRGIDSSYSGTHSCSELLFLRHTLKSISKIGALSGGGVEDFPVKAFSIRLGYLFSLSTSCKLNILPIKYICHIINIAKYRNSISF